MCIRLAVKYCLSDQQKVLKLAEPTPADCNFHFRKNSCWAFYSNVRGEHLNLEFIVIFASEAEAEPDPDVQLVSVQFQLL